MPFTEHWQGTQQEIITRCVCFVALANPKMQGFWTIFL